MARSTGNQDYRINVDGPFFTGAINGQMKKAIQVIEDNVAEDLVVTIQAIDDVTFRHPTGHARSKVTKQRGGSGLTVDRGRLAYGPWLEDGGSRSDIFPGYHAFKKATREVQQRVPDHANEVLEQYVIRPNQ